MKKYGFAAGGLLVAVSMASIPFGHLSAEALVSIDEKNKVRKASIISAPAKVDAWVVDIDGVNVTAYISTSTSVFLGTGEEVDIASIRGGEKVYIFGTYKKDSNTIMLEKIVLRNPSLFTRK